MIDRISESRNPLVFLGKEKSKTKTTTFISLLGLNPLPGIVKLHIINGNTFPMTVLRPVSILFKVQHCNRGDFTRKLRWEESKGHFFLGKITGLFQLNELQENYRCLD